jgi:uncharacterized membrane protein
MRRLSFGPALSLVGRERRGFRGFAGKPSHPPLTDVPIGAYIVAAVLDVISFVAQNQPWARDLFRAATFAFIVGAVASLPTALTGLADWRTTEPGTQVRRAANAHGLLMVTVTALVIANIALRLATSWDATSTPVLPLVLTLAGIVIMFAGAAIGGSLVYDYGFNVENSTDHPVWHRNEDDVYPDGTLRQSGPAGAEKPTRTIQS